MARKPLIVALGIALALVAPFDRARAFVTPNARTSTSLDMVYVPATTFHFGAQAEWGGASPGTSAFGPVDGIVVEVAPFYIDRTEVSVARYTSCVHAGKCEPPTKGDADNDCTYDRSGFEQHPINCLSWDEAAQFCSWLGKRLPTEIEWELAERGPSERSFPWGEDLPTPRHINACDASCVREMTKRGSSYTSLWADSGGDDGWAITSPVGTYPAGASPYGALDLSGNVEEWVADIWGPVAAVPPTATSPNAYEDHVVRGGSWDLASYDAFTAVRRTQASKDTRAAWLGFRCARAP